MTSDREPLVPRRALIVGPTVERAAVLAPYFDSLHIITPDDVSAEVLAGSGRAILRAALDGGAS